ncbi:MAG: family efflux transporter permease subunit [Marmoricola sp.]|nr:family efflux transporter permease subunit [Marmoricola sp.]
MTRQQRLTLAISVLGAFVTFLDGSVINVALPAISKELGGGITAQLWIVDAYLISLGTLVLLAGSLSDAYGQLRILRIGLIGFGSASLLIAVAPNTELLIALRAIQGIGGALLVPSSLALIISAFKGPAQARAIGMWTGLTASAFIAGPLVGGLFVDYLSWRLVFAVNLVPIATTLVLIALLKHPKERTKHAPIDWVSAVLGIVGLGGPVYALIEQASFGWANPTIYIPCAVGVIAITAFVFRQRAVSNPMIPPQLFTVRNFAVGNIATALFYAALSLGGFVITVYLQEVAGYSATFAGLSGLPISIASIFLASRFGTLAGKHGPRWFMGFGPILAGVGYLLILATGTHVDYWTEVLPGIVLLAIGLAATVSPLTAAVLGAIPPERAGIGSAINNAASRVAGLVATAVVGVILGEQLNEASFHRALIVTAIILFVAGGVSLAGIRNPKTAVQIPLAITTQTGCIPLPTQTDDDAFQHVA